MTRADFSGLHRLAGDLSQAGAQALPKAKIAVQKTGNDVAASGKMGGRYKNITGDNRETIGFDLIETGGSVAADIGPATNYGRFLEFGTSRRPPDPYMQPALEKHAPGFEKAIESLGGSIL